MTALELGAADYVRKPLDIGELRHVVVRALCLRDLRRQSAGLKREPARRPFASEPDGCPIKEVLEDFGRTLIQKALQHAGGVQTRAAEMLGTTRRILRCRIEKLKIGLGDQAA
ncbi:MAG: helix-turn-helix domain-containing protein [Kiritimatiellales bacterium]|jgi:DNA-binding NtrC family response regulator